MSMPLYDHPCYGVVLCPFGLPAGMHADAAWSTVSVADLSVLACRVPGVGSPSCQARPDHSCRNVFDAWSLPFMPLMMHGA